MKKRPDTPETAVLARNVSNAAREALFRPPTPRESARTRALAKLPIEDARELVCNLMDIADRITKHTALWYFMNDLIRRAMHHADTHERKTPK
jgi:hypothetical protein